MSIPGASYFVFTGDEKRVRRVRDVITAVLGSMLVVWAVVAVDRQPDWALSFVELVASAPEWVGSMMRLGYLLSLLYALVVLWGLVFRRGKDRSAIRDVLLVLTLTMLLVLSLSWLVNGAWPYVLPEIDLQNPEPRFPVTRVALVTGLLVVTAPYLTKPLRRFGWLAIILTALAAIGLGYGSPIHAIGSFGVGMVAAGLILVVVGTPRGYPAPESVSQNLTALGVVNRDLKQSDKQRWGLVQFDAIDGDGSAITVKVHGRDSFDSQLAAKIWRTLTYKEIGRTVSFSRVQAVEHEALGYLMAERAGVSVPRLRAVGQVSAEMALVAVDTRGTSLDVVPVDEVSDELLVAVWAQVAVLHASAMTHGSLSTSTVRIDDGAPILTDLELCSFAPEDDDRAGDVVGLMFSLALRFGADRTVRTALEGLGEESLVAALPYLQVPAVRAPLRRDVDKPKEVIADLKARLLDATGVEAPEPVELRRVSAKRLIGLALILLVVVAILPLFTQVDYAEIWSVIQNADWVLITVAVIVGHTQFFPQATSTMFAVPVPLPFWPLLVLQTASQFISLAIPSSAGRVAMNAAFLRKFGSSLTLAITQGAIDGFSGFLVQAVILITLLLTGQVELGLNIDASDVPWLLILGILVLVLIAVVITVLKVESLNKRIVPVVKQAREAFKVVLKQPSRALGLLGSNFVYWNVLGVTLWIILDAVGAGLPYGQALFVAAGTSLLAGFMPVPGGVGVAEATMTALLATFGVDQSVALAVTAVYRLITFYLPALEGMFGTRWLERNDYI
ncbi:MAG TPA: flippase-like domain-containing protein [Acidimicrobiia bacterium]|nr:flippase-like domain-containing protein [Acidimicrobiia bacterium]